MTAALAAIATSFEKPVGGGDLAVFKPEALGLEDPEELLDQPAALVPFDDAPSLFCIGCGVRGERPASAAGSVPAGGIGLGVSSTKVSGKLVGRLRGNLLGTGRFRRRRSASSSCAIRSARCARAGGYRWRRLGSATARAAAGRVQARCRSASFTVVRAAGGRMEALAWPRSA